MIDRLPMLNERMRGMVIPPRIAKLPISPEGYPTPWFVTWFDERGEPTDFGTGTPDFRVADSRKIGDAIRNKRCWVCGEKMGSFLAYCVGPMCTVNRISAEPPSHHECAMFSVRACPFLSQPRMRRNEKDLPEYGTQSPAGIMIARNPGVTAVWITKTFKVFETRGGKGAERGQLIQLGDPTSVFWFTQGREATRAEVLEAFETGLPTLMNMAKQERDSAAAVAELEKLRKSAMELLPAA